MPFVLVSGKLRSKREKKMISDTWNNMKRLSSIFIVHTRRWPCGRVIHKLRFVRHPNYICCLMEIMQVIWGRQGTSSATEPSGGIWAKNRSAVDLPFEMAPVTGSFLGKRRESQLPWATRLSVWKGTWFSAKVEVPIAWSRSGSCKNFAFSAIRQPQIQLGSGTKWWVPF